MSEIVYLRMKSNLEVSNQKPILLKDIAFISTTSFDQKKIEDLVVYRITEKDKEFVVLDGFIIIQYLNDIFHNININLIGPTHTIIKVHSVHKKKPFPLVLFVWLLLLIGSAMTIINFHADVNMLEAHQKIHYLLTGREKENPLWIQIPYSIGLGVGMLLFFNRWFKKRFNEEPSPLEVELFNYQQNLDQYISHYENKLNE